MGKIILKVRKFILCLIVIAISFSCNKVAKNEILVENKKALEEAIHNAKPGDVILLSNGEWKDLELKFYAVGTENAPIVLKAQEKGKVFITGKSFLKIGGEYLKIKDLHFKDGYTTDKAVIRFKVDNNKIAKNCTVSNCVIENFTQPDRNKKDHWVEFWGQKNQLDHCYITGKGNQGPTLRVFLKGNENINTYHKIFANHFGPRPRKGGPRAETMQIGDSYTSMTPAYVKVEKNYFEKCNGEVEIISSKSNFNEFNHNIFYQCEGSLVLRHGNYNRINGNIFIGSDSSEFIGGIRVINTGHWITNNYFYNLKGKEFRAPLAVMNGIPKSPLNRYNQVTDVVVANNSWVNCKSPFHIGVGANLEQRDVLPPSEIRSARPERVIIANNILFNQTKEDIPIVTYDKVDGISFYKNLTNNLNKSKVQTEGIITQKFETKVESSWLQIPTAINETSYDGFEFKDRITADLFGNKRVSNTIGAIQIDGKNISKEIKTNQYGTDWFHPNDKKVTEEEFTVSNAMELKVAIEKTKEKAVIYLTGNDYKFETSLDIKKKIKITPKDSNEKINFIFTPSVSAFVLHPNSNLEISGLNLKGNKKNKVFTTLKELMHSPYNLVVNDISVEGFQTILEVSKGSFADEISIKNSQFTNCENGILLNKETNDKGDYNAEFLKIENTTFNKIKNNVVDYYRGGYDESTIGGNLILKNSKFINCGRGTKNEILIKTRGIVNMVFEDNTFTNNAVDYIAILWGAKGQKGVNNTIQNSGILKVEENLALKLIY